MVLGLLRDVDVVGAASDGAEAVALAEDLRPDIVLMDLRMPRCDGVEATRLLRERLPGIKVIVLTTYSDDRSVLDALRAGARGYLTKDAGGAEIRQAIQQVLDDHAVIDPAVQHHLIDAIATAPPAHGPPAPPPVPRRSHPPRGRGADPHRHRPVQHRDRRAPRSSAKAPSRAISTGCWPRSALATVPRRSRTPTSTGSSDEPGPRLVSGGQCPRSARASGSPGPSGAGAPMQVAARAGSAAPLIHTWFRPACLAW